MRQQLKKSKRWIIKIGTSSLTTAEGHFSPKQLEAIVSQTTALLKQGIEVVLVSSGAISLGMDTLKLSRRPADLAKLQACAAIGQGKLIHAYESAFSSRGFHTAQVLLTRSSFHDRKRYVNARNTIEALLRVGVVPVVNENDTVATEEIKFGDNDMLAAQLADLINANLLVFLSDIDGFYLKDKTILRQIYSTAELREYTSHIHAKRSEKTAGGMKAKVKAATMAMDSGIPIVLANGRDGTVIDRILKGEEVGSLFHPSKQKVGAKKKWLAHSASVKGSLIVDDGAAQALIKRKKSLLSSGVLKCSGRFQIGDLVEICTEDKTVIGRGLVTYSKDEAVKICGKKTTEIVSVLGYNRCDELVHRNNMALVAK